MPVVTSNGDPGVRASSDAATSLDGDGEWYEPLSAVSGSTRASVVEVCSELE